jgi:hypothetical protein
LAAFVLKEKVPVKEHDHPFNEEIKETIMATYNTPSQV